MKSESNYTVRVKNFIQDAVVKAGGRTLLARKLGIRPATVTAWFQGTIPRGDSMVRLEKYLKKRL